MRFPSRIRTPSGALAGALFLVVVALGWPTAGWTKSYAIEGIDVEATVRPDGSLAVVEEITYVFNGSFTYAFRDVPLKPGETLREVSVRDGRREYRLGGGSAPGTFKLVSKGPKTTITWYYRASNERETFYFSYVVGGVVKRHPDVAELYYKFVGGDWDRSIGDVRVTVHPPAGTSRSDVRAWAHGPLNGTIDIAADGVVRLGVSHLPARTYWEGRILYPQDRFAAVPAAGDRPQLETIMSEERAWAAEANRKREARIESMRRAAALREQKRGLAKKFLAVSIVAGLLVLMWWYRAFLRYGRPHRVAARTARGEIPSAHRPAILSYLLHRGVSGAAMVATLLDLADRGYFTITESRSEKKGWFGRMRSETDYRFDLTGKRMQDLEPFEMQLVEFLITEAGDVTGFTMSGLKEAATRHRATFRKWFMKWSKKVKEVGKKMDFFEPYPSSAMALNAIAGVLLMVAGIVFCKLSDSASGAAAIGSGVLTLFLTLTLQRRTVEGKRLHVAWKEFHAHLRSIGKALGPVRLDSNAWGRYMAAAIIFGMHKQLFPKLQMVGDDGAAMVPVWFLGSQGSGASFDGSLSSLASGLSTMVTSVSTTMSSASGTGGGASGGGGGGSGGGGGGAG